MRALCGVPFSARRDYCCGCIETRTGAISCRDDGMVTGGTNRATALAAPVIVGLGWCVAIAIADVVGGDDVILIPLLVTAPIVTAIRGTARQTIAVGVVALVFAVGLGWVDDIEGTRRHLVAVATTIAGAVIAALLAATRDRERSRTLPALRQADRLRATLATGHMGEWSWNLATDQVTWDDNVGALYGRFDETFAGTFDAWMELIDARDRSRVRRVVEAAVSDRSTFRFDHRCAWPDGSIHWIEGIGEVIVEDDQALGAFGLAIDVDERHRQVDERNRLLAVERRERRRVEFLTGVHDVLALSIDTDEIVDRVTTSIIPQWADWCSIVVSADRPSSRPLIRVAHRDPAMVEWARKVEHDYPYDPNAPWGAANVIRTGTREFVERVDPRIFEFAGGDVLREAGVGSLVTVPLVGAVGTLGAMQLIRGPETPAFTTDDLDFVDELATRVGSALNTAVLFERQARGRGALDTLERVSGSIASLANRQDVIRAALVHGSRGVGALAGTIFLIDDDGDPVSRQTVGAPNAHDADAELDAARDAIRDEALTTRQVPELGTVIGVPMRIMNRTTGSIVLIVPNDHLLAPEELSMLVTLGSRCAGALERASLYERERTVALALQHRLLSVLPSTPAWLDAAARYVPATALDIGGDWFQILDAGDGRIAAVVGDAVGHGVTAAAAMGQLRASIATAVANDPAPGQTLAAADLFARRGADTLGACVGSILLDSTGRNRFACAGLPPPVLARAGGSVEFLIEGRRPLLGVGDSDVEYPEGSVDLASGDVLVMYTDGLVERRGESIDDGLDRLRRAVENGWNLPPDELCDRLLAEVAADESDDDIALLILRHR